MNLSEIIGKLEALAPPSFAEDWDNPGLQTGRAGAEIRKIYVAVDATEETIAAAEAAGCELLVTHHPLLFHPLKNVTEETAAGRRVLSLAEHGVACFSLHTNFDSAPGGMADAAAARLGLSGTRPMEPLPQEPSAGLGRVGRLPEAMTAGALCEAVKAAFGLEQVLLYGDPGRTVQTLAVLPGSGGREWTIAKDLGADAYLTGDVTYHHALDAAAEGLTVIDAGHYGIEWIFVPILAEYLKKELPADVEVLCAGIRQPVRAI